MIANSLKYAFGMAAISFATVVAVGCGSDDPGTDANGNLTTDTNEANCNSYCSRKQACFTSSTDVTKCTTSCTTQSKNDAEFKGQVEECTKCISGKECTETQGCGGDCLKVLINE